MGIVSAIGDCAGCGAVFVFAPSKVPAIRVNGVKEPICESCLERWKKHHNKPDYYVHPMAYIGDDEDEDRDRCRFAEDDS